MRVGSLCTGYGGLDHAVMEVFGGNLAWVADNHPASSRLLAYRYPAIPNLGDISKVNWNTTAGVDILTAGFPCQPISTAGKNLGTEDERWLWPEVARAVRDLRPRLIVLENVAAILGRGLGIVLGDLAAAGYVGSYRCVQAADVGAPHERDRWFAVAYPHSEGRTWHPREERTDGVPAPCGGDPSWDIYMDPISRWEGVMGRAAPPPVVPSRARDRLNPLLVEWMMGLPEGWVTATPGLSYVEQLHLLGNGVVPQQAVRAVRSLVS